MRCRSLIAAILAATFACATACDDPDGTGETPDPAKPPLGGDCDFREVPGTVDVREFWQMGDEVDIRIQFRAEGSPHSDQAPSLYDETSYHLPCTQCVPQLGIRRGESMPYTAQVNVGHKSCSTLIYEPWDVARCDCSAAPLLVRLYSVTMEQISNEPILPLDGMGNPPDVDPNPSASVTPPDPFTDDERAPVPLTIEGCEWRCAVSFDGAEGRALSASVRCEGSGDPVENQGTCAEGAGGQIASLPDDRWGVRVSLLCGPDFGDR